MTATITNKEDENYGKSFLVCTANFYPKFVGISINGNIRDYGYSEIKIIAESKRDYWSIGQYIQVHGNINTMVIGIREAALIRAINKLNLLLIKAMTKKDLLQSVQTYIFN